MPLATRVSALALPLTLAAGFAHAVEVQTSIAVEAPPEEVWEAVGAFCSIGDWHPEVVSCSLEEDDVTTYRTIETEDGTTFRDQLIDQQEELYFYSYSLVESPLPVTGLVGEFEIIPGPDDSSSIVWQSQYSTLAVEADEAEDRLRQFYRTGLEGIARMFDESAS